MNTYCVYLPPTDLVTPEDDRVAFLPDTKSVLAAFAPPLWLAWHRLWWELLVYVGLVAILMLLILTPLKYGAFLLSAIPGIYLFLEGRELIRNRLERKSWRFAGVVQGRDEEEAQLRYFTYRSQIKPATETLGIPSSIPAKPVTLMTQSESIGLFGAEQ